MAKHKLKLSVSDFLYYEREVFGPDDVWLDLTHVENIPTLHLGLGLSLS